MFRYIDHHACVLTKHMSSLDRSELTTGMGALLHISGIPAIKGGDILWWLSFELSEAIWEYLNPREYYD